ncbi:MAG: DbpA RNA binding domain-containing protein [Treponema sp.]|jgi:hypothetical protein|nr:DbpA RNA binding domain-containing protein [Treponema sp.]
MPSQLVPEKTRKRLAEIVEKIHSEADLELLNQYRALFKKEISFFKRSSVAAYLLMEADQKSGRRAGTQGSRSRGSIRTDFSSDEERRADSKAYPLAEEESARLFISAGRSRRIFPREILGMLISKASVSREDVGAIRILDNYSFVQVRATKADEIIEALKGVSFRGRPLTVNYARIRKAEDDQGDSFPDDSEETGRFEPDREEFQADPEALPEDRAEESAQEGDYHTDKEGV